MYYLNLIHKSCDTNKIEYLQRKDIDFLFCKWYDFPKEQYEMYERKHQNDKYEHLEEGLKSNNNRKNSHNYIKLLQSMITKKKIQDREKHM